MGIAFSYLSHCLIRKNPQPPDRVYVSLPNGGHRSPSPSGVSTAVVARERGRRKIMKPHDAARKSKEAVDSMISHVGRPPRKEKTHPSTTMSVPVQKALASL